MYNAFKEKKLGSSKKSRFVINLLLLLLCSAHQHNLYAQNADQNTSLAYTLSKRYTTDDGLPSNKIYQTVEDNKGTLWLATDNGVSRFDGKRFHNYTTQNGLLGNDVIQIQKDNDGTIWANSYTAGLTYYDDKENSFKTPLSTTAEMLNEWRLNNYILFYITKNGFQYNATNSSFYIHNKQISRINKGLTINGTSALFLDDYIFFKKNQNNNIVQFFILKNGKTIDSCSIDKNIKILLQKEKLLYNYFYNSNLFIATEKYFIKIQPIQLHPLVLNYTVMNINTRIKKITEYNNKIINTNEDGSVTVLDINNFKKITEISGDFISNRAIIDNYDNMWICSNGQGLLKYQKPVITTLNNNFTTLTTYSALLYNTKIKKLLIGSEDGKVFGYDSINTANTIFISKNISNPIHSLFYVKNKIAAIGYFDITIGDSKKQLIADASLIIGIKCATKINDSLLLLGGYNSFANLAFYNIPTRTFKKFNFKELNRVYYLEKFTDSIYIVGATGGLFYFDIYQNTIKPVLQTPFNYSISTVLYHNNIIWAATIGHGIWAIENGKIVAHYTEFNQKQTNISSIKVLEKDKLIIGTNSGVKLLHTVEKNNSLFVQEEKNKILDILNTANIKCIEPTKDSFVYISANENLYKINYKKKLLSRKVNLFISNVSINGADTSIQQAYTLPSGKNHFEITVLAASLTNDCYNIQYSFDDTLHWQVLDESKLIFDFENGAHKVFLKSNAYNKEFNSDTISLSFIINIPFYQRKWFWVLLTSLLTGMLFSTYYYRKNIGQQRLMAQQKVLDQQRQEITADLHDDIGASLSSLQLNTTVAAKLLDNNIDDAKAMMKKVEKQSEVLAERIGDFIWSMKPKEDELMPLSMRIQNFITQVFDGLGIETIAHIDKQIDTITFIKFKKNILLITKEALNNAAKYSKATRVVITIEQVNNTIHINIKDNGIGFNTVEKAGNGLYNIKTRASELNGTVKIESSPNKGVEITIIIPYDQSS